MLVFDQVSKYYGVQAALKNVSVEVMPKDFVVLIGHTGAGKSTFLKLIIRDELPSKGRVFIDGIDTISLSEKDIPSFRRKIGVVFQDFKLLLKKTVFENVAFALEVCGVKGRVIKKKVDEILEKVALEHKKNSCVFDLSGGEKQRVAIARALVHDPILLLADEPTGNIDPKSSEEIINLLLKINNSGTTIILATHNKDVVKQVSGRVIALKNGEIVADKKNCSEYITI